MKESIMKKLLIVLLLCIGSFAEKKNIEDMFVSKALTGCNNYEDTFKSINFNPEFDMDFDNSILEFDATLDGIIDCVVVQKDENDPWVLSIIVLTKKKKYNFGINGWMSNIDNCGKGCFHVKINGKHENILDEKYYYSKKYDCWFDKQNFSSIKNLMGKNSKQLFSIVGIGDRNIPIDSLLTLKDKLSKLTYKEIKDVNYQYLDYYLEHYQLSKKTLTTYNNIAYYLQKAGSNEEAVYLLEKILEKFPKRMVAYYNLGDAYWALEEKEKAKKAYSTYIQMMKAKGKEKRIPKVVRDRVLSKVLKI